MKDAGPYTITADVGGFGGPGWRINGPVGPIVFKENQKRIAHTVLVRLNRAHEFAGSGLLGTLRQAVSDLERTRNEIRNHRDTPPDDRCWENDIELYKVLPEYDPDDPLQNPVLPPPEEMRANCDRYIACRHTPGMEYISPQREIERLTSELEALKKKRT